LTQKIQPQNRFPKTRLIQQVYMGNNMYSVAKPEQSFQWCWS